MTDPEETMYRTSMINRVGCLAIVIGIVLILLIATAVTYTILQSKRRAADRELDALREIVLTGLDFPRPLGRYIRGEAGFNMVMSSIDALKGPIESAENLGDLEALYEEYKLKSHEIRRMIDPTMAEDQAVRNQEAQIDGIFNRWREQRKAVVDAVDRYNQALGSFPESIVGSIFGMKEIPLNTSTSQEGE